MVALMLVLVHCGGGAEGTAPSETSTSSPQLLGKPLLGPPPCQPHGSVIELSVIHQRFSKACIAAPAETAFAIRFSDREPTDSPLLEAVRHNVGIYARSPARGTVFSGSYVDPQKRAVYRIRALPRGLYYFQCDIHPFMHGTLAIV